MKKLPPLHEAAREGRAEEVQKQLQGSWWRPAAKVNATDRWGCTALHYAAESGSLKTLEALLQAGADPASVNRFTNTPLHNAARHGCRDLANRLMQAGTPLNAGDGSQATALHWAAREGFLEIVQDLVTAGADPFAQDKDGLTPADWAEKRKQPTIAHWLRQTAASNPE